MEDVKDRVWTKTTTGPSCVGSEGDGSTEGILWEWERCPRPRVPPTPIVHPTYPQDPEVPFDPSQTSSQPRSWSCISIHNMVHHNPLPLQIVNLTEVVRRIQDGLQE